MSTAFLLDRRIVALGGLRSKMLFDVSRNCQRQFEIKGMREENACGSSLETALDIGQARVLKGIDRARMNLAPKPGERPLTRADRVAAQILKFKAPMWAKGDEPT